MFGFVCTSSYIYIHNFIPEMTQIGFVFDVDEVMKVLEDAKTDIQSNASVTTAV